MDVKSVQILIDLARKNNVAELDVTQGEERVHIVMEGKQQNVTLKESHLSEISPPEVELPVSPSVETSDCWSRVKSPMVGTVYLAASPNTRRFVEVGQRVEIGDTLCMIEAMKMFNRIEAESGGVVRKITVDDAQPVEYGQELFWIE